MIPTAEEFLRDKANTYGDRCSVESATKAMIEFAKLHIDYVRSLQKAKYYAGQSGYIIRAEWEEIIENIK